MRTPYTRARAMPIAKKGEQTVHILEKTTVPCPSRSYYSMPAGLLHGLQRGPSPSPRLHDEKGMLGHCFLFQQ